MFSIFLQHFLNNFLFFYIYNLFSFAIFLEKSIKCDFKIRKKNIAQWGRGSAACDRGDPVWTG